MFHIRIKKNCQKFLGKFKRFRDWRPPYILKFINILFYLLIGFIGYLLNPFIHTLITPSVEVLPHYLSFENVAKGFSLENPPMFEFCVNNNLDKSLYSIWIEIEALGPEGLYDLIRIEPIDLKARFTMSNNEELICFDAVLYAGKNKDKQERRWLVIRSLDPHERRSFFLKILNMESIWKSETKASIYFKVIDKFAEIPPAISINPDADVQVFQGFKIPKTLTLFPKIYPVKTSVKRKK